jgi:hypothetical protein
MRGWQILRGTRSEKTASQSVHVSSILLDLVGVDWGGNQPRQTIRRPGFIRYTVCSRALLVRAFLGSEVWRLGATDGSWV